MITILDAALGACTLYLYFYLIGDFVTLKIALGVLFFIALLESVIEVTIKVISRRK